MIALRLVPKPTGPRPTSAELETLKMLDSMARDRRAHEDAKRAHPGVRLVELIGFKGGEKIAQSSEAVMAGWWSSVRPSERGVLLVAVGFDRDRRNAPLSSFSAQERAVIWGRLESLWRLMPGIEKMMRAMQGGHCSGGGVANA